MTVGGRHIPGPLFSPGILGSIEAMSDESAHEAALPPEPEVTPRHKYDGMKKAEYPQRTCREPVYNDQSMGYTCELPDVHPGPCATFSVKTSVTRRESWERRNPGWERQIGNMDIIV